MTGAALFVDDEAYVLHSLERLFRESPLRILQARGAREALDCLEREEIAVIISDNLMPGVGGIDLLTRVKEISPDTIRILMTAYADLPTAISAINRGEVFRFIVKPWDNEELLRTVEDAVNRYRIIRSLRHADEATLRSLAQTIELKDPYTRGHCDRVASYALLIAEALHLPETTRQDIRYGSWLHDCGKIGVPEEILNHRGPLHAEQFELVKNHPVWGAEVARQADLSPGVVEIILRHHEKYDGSGYPSGLSGEQIPLAARIVAVADVFDALVTERPYAASHDRDTAFGILHRKKGTGLDPRLVEIFLSRMGAPLSGPGSPAGIRTRTGEREEAPS